MAPTRGRPSTATYPTVVAQHRDTGQTIAWSDGHFGGDPTFSQAARNIFDAAEPVDLGPVTLPITNDPAGAAAAMLAALCGRGVLLGESAELLSTSSN